MPALLNRFVRDDRGMLTFEAMLWLPMLIFWMIGSIAWFDAWLSRNQAAKVAYTISDIMSRQEQVSPTFIYQVDAMQTGLLTRASAPATMRLSSIQRTQDGYEVRWSCSNSTGAPPLTDGGVPTGVMPVMGELDTIILTELYVPWTRFSGMAGLTETTWSFQVVTSPRVTPALEMVGSCV